MRKNLLKLIEQVEKNNNVITVEEIENILGTQTYVKNLGNFKRIWVFEDNKEKELIHLTIRFGPYTDTVEVLNYDIFSL
jgi:hypothetical protein